MKTMKFTHHDFNLDTIHYSLDGAEFVRVMDGTMGYTLTASRWAAAQRWEGEYSGEEALMDAYAAWCAAYPCVELSDADELRHSIAASNA